MCPNDVYPSNAGERLRPRQVIKTPLQGQFATSPVGGVPIIHTQGCVRIYAFRVRNVKHRRDLEHPEGDGHDRLAKERR